MLAEGLRESQGSRAGAVAGVGHGACAKCAKVRAAHAAGKG